MTAAFRADSLLFPFFVRQKHRSKLAASWSVAVVAGRGRDTATTTDLADNPTSFIFDNCGKIDIIRQYGFNAIWEFPCEWCGVAVDASETVQYAARGGLKLITIDLQNRTFVAIRRCQCAM